MFDIVYINICHDLRVSQFSLKRKAIDKYIFIFIFYE